MSGESESNGVKNGKCFVSSWESDGDKKGNNPLAAIFGDRKQQQCKRNDNGNHAAVAAMLSTAYTCSKTIMLATAEEIQNRSN